MRELDQLFGRYLDREWAHASDAERGVFLRLLDCEDDKLWHWFMGHERCRRCRTRTRLSSASVSCRLEWRPSRWLIAALLVLGMLAAFSRAGLRDASMGRLAAGVGGAGVWRVAGASGVRDRRSMVVVSRQRPAGDARWRSPSTTSSCTGADRWLSCSGRIAEAGQCACPGGPTRCPQPADVNCGWPPAAGCFARPSPDGTIARLCSNPSLSPSACATCAPNAAMASSPSSRWPRSSGIALGVTALITTLAVMSGFQREIRDRMLQMTAHATVSADGEPMTDWPHAVAVAKRDPRVDGAAPYIDIAGADRRRAQPAGMIRGVIPAEEKKVSVLAEKMKRGSWTRSRPARSTSCSARSWRCGSASASATAWS